MNDWVVLFLTLGLFFIAFPLLICVLDWFYERRIQRRFMSREWVMRNHPCCSVDKEK